MAEITTLQALFDWIIRIGAMLLAFNIVERAPLPYSAEVRRYAAFAVGAVIGLLAWGLGIEFGYIQQPVPDWHAWVESAAAVVLTIVIGAQVVHARTVLSKPKV